MNYPPSRHMCIEAGRDQSKKVKKYLKDLWTSKTKSFKISKQTQKKLFLQLEALFVNVYTRKKYDNGHKTRVGQRALSIGMNRRYSQKCPAVNQAPFDRYRERLLNVLQTVKNIVSSSKARQLLKGRSWKYTTVQINRNYPGNLHTDRNNAGPSAMITVGAPHFRGGELYYNGKLHKTHGRCVFFDGRMPHMTAPYKNGPRYSIVMYTTKDACQKCSLDKRCRNLRDKHIPAYPSCIIPLCKSYSEFKKIIPRGRDLLRSDAPYIRENIRRIFGKGVPPQYVIKRIKKLVA